MVYVFIISWVIIAKFFYFHVIALVLHADGKQFVMIVGAQQMHELSVDKWDSLPRVQDNIHIKCYNKYTNSWYIHIIGAIARTNAYYGRGTAPILLDDIACSGTESSLTDRTYDPTQQTVPTVMMLVHAAKW